MTEPVEITKENFELAEAQANADTAQLRAEKAVEELEKLRLEVARLQAERDQQKLELEIAKLQADKDNQELARKKLQLEVDKLQLEQERKELENRRIRAEADKAELEKTKLQLEIATQQRHAGLETARLKAEVALKQQQAYEKERENSIWLQSEDDDEVSRRGWEDYEKRAAALRRANGFN